MTMKHDNSKPIGFSKSSFKKEVYKSYLKKQEKNQINNLTVHLKQLENNWKKKKKSTKISRRKEIIKIQAEINEKEMKETIVKINKTLKLVLWEDKQNWQTFGQTHQEKEREESTQQNYKWNRSSYNRQYRNTKDYKRLLWTTIWQ